MGCEEGQVLLVLGISREKDDALLLKSSTFQGHRPCLTWQSHVLHASLLKTNKVQMEASQCGGMGGALPLGRSEGPKRMPQGPSTLRPGFVAGRDVSELAGLL